MNLRRAKSILTFLFTALSFAVILVAIPCVIYLKVLPWAVSNPKVINYFEDIAQKSLNTDVEIKNPVLKTGLSPDIYFSLDKAKISDKKVSVLDVDNFNTEISLSEIFHKRIIVKKVNLDYLYADVNKILDLPVFKQQTPSTKSDVDVDIFQSVLNIKNAGILYRVDKNTTVKLNVKDLRIDDNVSKKQVKYNLSADIKKGKNNLLISSTDYGNVYLENKEKIVIKDSEILINDSKISFDGTIDNKSNFNLTLFSKKFSISYVIDLLNSQIVENNLTEQFVYFKDIDGNFDFDVKLNNKGIAGNLDLNKLSFKLVPFMNLPVLLNNGKVSFDNERITLKDFKGYYNGKPSNKMDFEGTVDDYFKSVNTNLVGNAVVTNDFSKNYLSKMLGYPMEINGQADTRIMLKSIFNKIDLVWLFRFKKGTGFVIDGEESFLNNNADRVLAAKMHFEDMLLNIESIDYYAGDPEHKNKNSRIPILSINSNIDFSNGKTFVKDFGLELPKPMPSGFINMLLKQKLFKNGTFKGYVKVINTGKYPTLQGDVKVEKVAVPSQRLFIRNAELKTDNGRIHLNSDGRFRRSEYKANAEIINEIKFPVIVKTSMLSVDNVDVMKYLQMFNNQNSDNQQPAEVQVAYTEEDDDSAQTFDFSNLIIEECILKADKGSYKKINFANVIANLTLDKNSILKITSNKFDIADGYSSAKISCDLKNLKYSFWLALVKVNSDIIASELLNLPREIDGKASGLIDLNADKNLKLNGRIQFRIYDGIIAKIGLVEYAMKVAALFRNPLTMISPTVVSDLVSIPEGRFKQIDGDLILKNNVVEKMMIKSSAPQLSSFIIGKYNLETQDAALRIYTKFSNHKKGLYGFLRNISLNSLANRIPLSSRNDSNYYSAEISQLPEIEADEKDCQIFLTKIDGDIVQNNFLSSLKKIK